MRRLLLIPFLALTACLPPPPSAPPPSTTSTTTTTIPASQQKLNAVVAEVWPTGSLPTQNVRWVSAIPYAADGSEYAGYAYGTCVLTLCDWVITVHPDYTTKWVVAHEGGHVVCWHLYFDRSELCADSVARNKGYTPGATP